MDQLDATTLSAFLQASRSLTEFRLDHMIDKTQCICAPEALEQAVWPKSLRVLELTVAHPSISAKALLALRNMRIVCLRTVAADINSDVDEKEWNRDLVGGSLSRQVSQCLRVLYAVGVARNCSTGHV